MWPCDVLSQMSAFDLAEDAGIGYPSMLREGVNGKKMFSFGHCPNDGGGVYPCPIFLALFLRSAFLVNKKSLFLQKCQCIELLTVF